jgi:hypothetical protein
VSVLGTWTKETPVTHIADYMITYTASAIIATVLGVGTVLLFATRREYARVVARRKHPSRR